MIGGSLRGFFLHINQPEKATLGITRLFAGERRAAVSFGRRTGGVLGAFELLWSMSRFKTTPPGKGHALPLSFQSLSKRIQRRKPVRPFSRKPLTLLDSSCFLFWGCSQFSNSALTFWFSAVGLFVHPGPEELRPCFRGLAGAFWIRPPGLGRDQRSSSGVRSPSFARSRRWGCKSAGVDSFSILFNHRSVQKPAVFPEFLEVCWKEGSLERMGKVPLEKGPKNH